LLSLTPVRLREGFDQEDPVIESTPFLSFFLSHGFEPIAVDAIG
jgi:hypothetical protein